MTNGDVTKKARENYDQIIPEAVRPAGHDSDEKDLDWRIMNAMATEEKTTMMFARPSDVAGPRDTTGGYTTDETPEAMPQTQRSASGLCTQLDTARRKGDLDWAHTSDYVRVIVEHKETSEGAVLPEDVRLISVAPEVHRSSGAVEDEADRRTHRRTTRPRPQMQKTLCTFGI